MLVVTGYEREAAYLCTRETSSSASHTDTLTRFGIAKHAYNVADLEMCDATSDLRNISFLVTSYRAPVYVDDNCQSGHRYGELNGYYVFPGTSAGSTIKWREQLGYVPGWNGCLATWQQNTVFIAANINNVPVYQETRAARSTVDEKVSLQGSNGFKASISAASNDIDEWFRFIEIGMNDQSAHIVRDAFNPRRAAYSKVPNKTRGFELGVSSEFGPYDLSDVNGSTLAFVGVP